MELTFDPTKEIPTSNKEGAGMHRNGLPVEEKVPPAQKTHTAFWYTKMALLSLLAEEHDV